MSVPVDDSGRALGGPNDINDDTERSKREIEAEAVAYMFG